LLAFFIVPVRAPYHLSKPKEAYLNMSATSGGGAPADVPAQVDDGGVTEVSFDFFSKQPNDLTIPSSHVFSTRLIHQSSSWSVLVMK
jgi:hypothetical protein